MRHALIHRQYKRSTKARMKSWDDAFRYFMQDVFEMRSVVAGFVVVVSQETKRGVFCRFCICRQGVGVKKGGKRRQLVVKSKNLRIATATIAATSGTLLKAKLHAHLLPRVLGAKSGAVDG